MDISWLDVGLMELALLPLAPVMECLEVTLAWSLGVWSETPTPEVGSRAVKLEHLFRQWRGYFDLALRMLELAMVIWEKVFLVLASPLM